MGVNHYELMKQHEKDVDQYWAKRLEEERKPNALPIALVGGLLLAGGLSYLAGNPDSKPSKSHNVPVNKTHTEVGQNQPGHGTLHAKSGDFHVSQR